jgi:hypothetical protein
MLSGNKYLCDAKKVRKSIDEASSITTMFTIKKLAE